MLFPLFSILANSNCTFFYFWFSTLSTFIVFRVGWRLGKFARLTTVNGNFKSMDIKYGLPILLETFSFGASYHHLFSHRFLFVNFSWITNKRVINYKVPQRNMVVVRYFMPNLYYGFLNWQEVLLLCLFRNWAIPSSLMLFKFYMKWNNRFPVS